MTRDRNAILKHAKLKRVEIISTLIMAEGIPGVGGSK
jgi:hypothetical protein